MPTNIGQKIALCAALLLLTAGAVGTDQLFRWGVAQAVGLSSAPTPPAPRAAAPELVIQHLGPAMALGAIHLLDRSERPPLD